MLIFVLDNKTKLKGIANMAGIHKFETVNDYNDLNNHETLHPLVSIIDFSKVPFVSIVYSETKL